MTSISGEVEPSQWAPQAQAPQGDEPTASKLVRAALQPETSVDFPQITEICERLEVNPAEIRSAVSVLSKAIRGQRYSLRVKLKALTIANEMMYNQQAVDAFNASDGLREALEVLRNTRGGELGPAMDENVRMLATEVELRCFPDGAKSSWGSFSKAFNSTDWEKVQKSAKKNFKLFSQKADKALQKAEIASERFATMVMTEAEQMLLPPVEGSGGSSSSTQTSASKQGELTDRFQPPPRKPKPSQEDAAAWRDVEEDPELQWALNASLLDQQLQPQRQTAEAGISPSQPPSEPGTSAAAAASAEGEESNEADGSPAELEAEGKAQALEEMLAMCLAAEANSAEESKELQLRVQDGRALADQLCEKISEAERKLEHEREKGDSLEATLASARASVEEIEQGQSLQSHVAELEAELAKLKEKAVGMTKETIDTRKDTETDKSAVTEERVAAVIEGRAVETEEKVAEQTKERVAAVTAQGAAKTEERLVEMTEERAAENIEEKVVAVIEERAAEKNEESTAENTEPIVKETEETAVQKSEETVRVESEVMTEIEETAEEAQPAEGLQLPEERIEKAQTVRDEEEVQILEEEKPAIRQIEEEQLKEQAIETEVDQRGLEEKDVDVGQGGPAAVQEETQSEVLGGPAVTGAELHEEASEFHQPTSRAEAKAATLQEVVEEDTTEPSEPEKVVDNP